MASVFDGVLDLVIVDPMSLFDAPWFGTRLRLGNVHRSRKVKMERVEEVVIQGATQIHLDGEPLESSGELRVRVRPQSLSVLVPRDAKVI